MSGKKSGKKGDKSNPENKSGDNGSLFGKNPEVASVLESFLTDSAAFSSSTLMKLVMTKIATLNDVNEIFLVPIKERLLDFAGAKDFAFFLNSSMFRKFITEDLKYADYKFDVSKALDKVESVYDLSMEDYKSKIYEDEDEEGEEDEGHSHAESE